MDERNADDISAVMQQHKEIEMGRFASTVIIEEDRTCALTDQVRVAGCQARAEQALREGRERLVRVLQTMAEAVVAEVKVAGGQGLANCDDITRIESASRIVEAAQHQHLAARQQRAVDLERRILGGGADEEHRAVFHVGKEGVLLALVKAVNLVDEKQRALARRRYLLRIGKGLPKVGLTEFLPVDGAFYLYADVSKFNPDSFEFAKTMLQQAHVAATPGVDFDPFHGKSFVRFSYSRSTQEISEAVARITRWLAKG